MWGYRHFSYQYAVNQVVQSPGNSTPPLSPFACCRSDPRVAAFVRVRTAREAPELLRDQRRTRVPGNAEHAVVVDTAGAIVLFAALWILEDLERLIDALTGSRVLDFAKPLLVRSGDLFRAAHAGDPKNVVEIFCPSGFHHQPSAPPRASAKIATERLSLFEGRCSPNLIVTGN